MITMNNSSLYCQLFKHIGDGEERRKYIGLYLIDSRMLRCYRYNIIERINGNKVADLFFDIYHPLNTYRGLR